MDLAAHVESQFAARRLKNPRYSLRAFARDLGVDHGALSQLLARRRPPTERWVRRLAAPLGLDGARVRALVFRDHERRFGRSLRSLKEPPTARALATRSGLSLDEICVVLQGLLAEGRLRMHGATVWELVEAP